MSHLFALTSFVKASVAGDTSAKTTGNQKFCRIIKHDGAWEVIVDRRIDPARRRARGVSRLPGIKS